MPRKANPYVRVTEVCDFVDSYWKQFWYKKFGVEECERISRESTSFGRGVHKVAENHLIGSSIPEGLSERQLYCGGLIVQWCKEARVTPLTINGKPAVECELTSEEYGYRGHPDILATFGDDKTPWVVDWKTSKECRRGYILQASAYANAVKEMYGIAINDGAIVRTPSDPNVTPQFETHEFHNLLDRYFPVFVEALDIMDFFKKRKKWKQ